MKYRTFAFVVFAMLASPRFVVASCNIIPSGDGFSPSPPSDSVSLTRTFASVDQFPFKGALGRVDRAYVMPGVTQQIAVMGDGVCVNSSGPPVPVRIANPDDVVAAVLFEGAAGTYARVYASTAVCDALRAALAEPTSASGPRPPKILSCENAGFEILRSASSELAVVLPVRPLTIPANDKTKVGVRLVVAAKPATGTALGGLFTNVAAHTCAEKCAGFAEAGVIACVDDFFTLSTEGTLATADTGASSAARNSTGKWIPHQMPCELQWPEDDAFAANDFTQLCRDADGNPDTLPKWCQNSNAPLSLWRDECGGIHIPFKWTGIRDGTGQNLDRIVAGRSAASDKVEGEGPRIHLPGTEFVGSTPQNDLNRNTGGVNWLRPDFDLWELAGHAEEFGLSGVVDMNNSVVHIFPRVPIDMLCAADEACFGLEYDNKGDIDPCACEESHGINCKCLDEDGTTEYFVCEDGPFAGRPCTRKIHCGSGGTCTGMPRCVSDGSVWNKNADIVTGTECRTDSVCKADEQCGYGLFDFTARAGKYGVFTLDKEIKDTSARNERGVCDDGALCSKGGAGKFPVCSSAGKCTGYTLEAQGVRSN
jgi:hypothetical protein